MDLIIASNNKHKVEEIREILKGKFDNIYSLKDKGINVEVEEDGETFFDNALKKAREISQLVEDPVLADDSGLIVSALNGRPGVYSARFAGENATYDENNTKLLKEMEGIEDRTAYFQTVLILYNKDNSFISAVGKTEGEILHERKGTNGFGYDSLFYSYELKKSFGQASEKEKNSVSHRSKAIQNLLEKIPND